MKTLLASLTGYESDKAVLTAAFSLAQRLAAHVDCLHVSLDLVAAAPLRGSIPWQDVERDEAGRRARARAEFDAARVQAVWTYAMRRLGTAKLHRSRGEKGTGSISTKR